MLNRPKRIRFVFDVSGSMYRFQYDGRLQRSLETGTLYVGICLGLSDTTCSSAVMLMETFDKLSRKDKYVWDVRICASSSFTLLTMIR